MTTVTELQTLPYMSNFLRILLNINNWEKDFDDFFYTKVDSDYFKNKFIGNSIDYILKTNTFANSGCLITANSIIEAALTFATKHIKDDNKNLTMLFEIILKADREYYQLNDRV
jgi:hypothetical protein